MYRIIYYLAAILATIFVLAPHEYAHAYVAYKNGDPTAKMNGRLTLNPLKHLDLVGFVMITLVGFGWARPVPINPYNFKNYRTGMFTTAIAGVIVNYIIAFLAYPLYLVVCMYFPVTNSVMYYLGYFLEYVFYLTFVRSLCSFIFNILPLNPLDGFRVVQAFTRETNKVHRFLRDYGQVILIVLIVESFLCDLLVDFGVNWAENLDILGYVLTFAVRIIGKPITALWDWIIIR